MIKTSGLTARQPGFSHRQFADYLVQVHAPLSQGVSEFAGYAVTAFSAPLAGSAVLESAPDGMAEFWFVDDGARAGMATSPAAAAWFADSPKFVSAMTSFTETLIAEPPDRAALAQIPLAAVFVPEAAGAGVLTDLAAVLAAAPACRAYASSALTQTHRVQIPALNIPPMAGVAWIWADDPAAIFAQLRAVTRETIYGLAADQTLIRNPHA